MARKNQAGKPLKKRLIDLDLSVSELARRIKRPRESVSKAIHTMQFPLLRERVMEEIRRG